MSRRSDAWRLAKLFAWPAFFAVLLVALAVWVLS